jgi:hypothetical protein
MASKQKSKKPRQIGKQKIEKKPFINPKHKSTFWTILLIVILLILFIMNNTRRVPEQGPYPPNYNPERVEGN